MTRPDELVDELLSGYLDDALSDVERAHVERLLHSDPEIREELEQLRELRESLKIIAETDSTQRLDQGFADRVLQAAVARANAEGLGEAHPLVQVSEHPIGQSDRETSQLYRVAALVAVLAASIAVAVGVFRWVGDDGNHTGAVADLPDHDGEAIALVEPEAVELATGELATETPDSVGPSMMATVETPAADADPSIPSANAITKTKDFDTADRDLQNTPKRVVDIKRPAPLAAILVLDVRQTQAGRAAGAARKAVRMASIDAPSRKIISDEMAGFIQKLDQVATNEKMSLVFLEAPAKSLDRFYLHLLADEDGIESVGMSIALNAPVLKVVNSVRAEPTTIKHDSTAMELFSETGAVDQLAMHLGKLNFAPLRRNAALPTSQGPDVVSQVLVLVR